ncbi:MAG: response regulator [Candidatus Nitrosocosmicus sp.]
MKKEGVLCLNSNYPLLFIEKIIPKVNIIKKDFSNKLQIIGVNPITKKIKILLIDDEEDIALLFKDGLEIYGDYSVDIYNDPLKALHDFKPNSYDIVLIDIIMPEMNGLDFYAFIKKMNCKSKICFFSAAEYRDDKIRYMFPDLKEQKTILIQKPIRIKDLSYKIDEIINGKFEG